MKRKKKRRKRKRRKSKSYALDKSTFDLPKHLWIFSNRCPRIYWFVLTFVVICDFPMATSQEKLAMHFLAITFLCCDKTDFYLNKWYRSNDSYGFNTGNKENLFLLQHSLYCLVARPVSFVSPMIGLLV